MVLAGTDASFNAAGNYDNTGDGSADGSTTWTAVDRSTLTLP